MQAEYAAIVAPQHAPSEATEICRVGASRLAKLLLEWGARDPALRRRLNELVASAGPSGAGDLPTTAAPDAISDEPPALREDPEYMVGASTLMRRLFEAIRRYAQTSAPVLITGESGTGKELAARAIHERSSWSKGPFVAINCGALPATLIGSELFGYEKGAFTGASARKIGRIESANGGTLFLDEIGDLPLEMQAHMLRFLQEKTIERIGGCKSITINARVIAATHVNLREAVARGRFREDLYFRLNVLTLPMPPLRDRGDDIALLATFFLQQFAQEMGRHAMEFSPDAIKLMASYTWPGNVRELIACIRRAVVMADTPSIHAADLGVSVDSAAQPSLAGGLTRARADAEAGLVRTTLERNRFNVKQSALELGVSRVTLYRLIQKHDIRVDRTAFGPNSPLSRS